MRSAAQMFHAYTRAPWTSKTASIATRKRMTNKHTCRNWHGQVIFLHTPWLQGTCKTHATMCGQLGRLCQQSRGRGALEGARTCHCSRRGRWSCAHHAARSCRIMHTQVAQHCATTSGTTGPGLHSSGQARERPGSRCTATAGAGADPCHAWHAAAGPAAGRAGRGGAPEEGAIGVYGHGAARGAGPTGNQVHERAARQTAQLEHGAARR